MTIYTSRPRITGHCAEKGCGVAFDRAPGAINPDRCTRHALKKDGLELKKTTMPSIVSETKKRPTRPVLLRRKV